MRFITKKTRKKTRTVLFTLGRGGHTGEMLYMCQRYKFKGRFTKVYIVVADNDDL